MYLLTSGKCCAGTAKFTWSTKSPLDLVGKHDITLILQRPWAETAPPTEADNRSLLLFDSGDEVTVQAGEEGIRFLLVSGRPIEEPVAWYGPIVMNTQDELRRAFEELEAGTFLKPDSRE